MVTPLVTQRAWGRMRGGGRRTLHSVMQKDTT